ncbi:hypothetical protein HJC23_001640 [Cyclotella cryptica]|uniref:Uncharacterized protein n=1 Tax=Cyclotella cryptica TaxID=29204 RepID=A0ABD3QLB6_9STRA|eukprot:CCRYP_004667-RA/>CCRYP_004667-RA protein AED:0.03 eAED:-0.03 QI:0/-1/0/1/-1/1/1/0/780
MSTKPPCDMAAEPPLPVSGAAPKKKNKKKRKKITSDDPYQYADPSCGSNKLSLKKRLFLRKSVKQTPWYDSNELLSTGRGLLLALKLFPSPHNAHQTSTPNYDEVSGTFNSETPSGLTNDEHIQLAAALRRVALWRGRRGGKLPHAIDITAGLAGILLMDAERSCVATAVNFGDANNTMLPNVSLYQLRNAYSTLLLRSVNGLADTYRHQKKSALLSVAHCCSLAGLPLWIVDVRHDASHNDLPSLGVCRIGALESLKFWKGRYWDSLEEKVWGDIPTPQGDATRESGDRTSIDLKEAGVCTLAIDCLDRYQKAIEIEAVQRRNTQIAKKIKPEKKEFQRFIRWQKFSQKECIHGANDQDLCTIDDQHKQKGGEEDGVILLLSDEDDAQPQKADTSAKKQKLDDSKANPWWILSDNKPKKKKLKKVQPESLPNAEENTVSRGKKIEMADASDAPHPVSEREENKTSAVPSTGASSRDCVAELIRLFPVDVLYTSILRFLVWGGASNTFYKRSTTSGDDEARNECRGPALLTMFASSRKSRCQAELEDLFEESRISYEPLIISITSSYPGFLAALFVHLIDSILCFDTERRTHKQELEQSHDESPVGETAYENTSYLDEIEWNVQFLSMWACYILTREFHMHLDRSLAVINSIADASKSGVLTESESVDLKKKGRRKWTFEEQFFMECPVPYLLLREAGIPLNSVCDRLMSHVGGVPKKQGEHQNDVVMELLSIFERILGKERIIFNVGYTSVAEAANCNAWTLCKSWDACAIGTMPGFLA